jgi:signal transduction histidine kinase
MNSLIESHGRDLPFDLATCGGFCPQGSDFDFPKKLNLEPRLSFAWSPKALLGKTVIRGGSGFYKGEGQLGDLNAPSDNFTQRLSLSSASFPGLGFPADSFYAAAANQAVTPRALDRNLDLPTVIQWGLQIQTALPGGFVLDTGYIGYHGYHQFTRYYINGCELYSNPCVRALPAFGPIDVKGTSSNDHSAAAATIGHWTAGRALAPVLAITTAARKIDAADLSRRIEIPQSHDELRYLAETLNGMLARIESAFRKTIEFTANASHELRTPMAVIRATAEVALMRGADVEAGALNSDRAALRQILLEAERNTALLEDLLRLARADAGTASLRMKPVNAAESLRATCQECAPLAAKRGIHLRFDPPGHSAWVTADEGCLRSLFRIVLDNALKYTQAGGSVDAALLTDLPAYVICRIRDTGIGISEEDLPHIFERFYRSDRVRSREEGGAGLGLAIAEWMAPMEEELKSTALLAPGPPFTLFFRPPRRGTDLRVKRAAAIS